MKSHKSVLLLCLAVLVLVSLVSAHQTNAQNSGALLIQRNYTEAEQAAALAYWTPERMAAAKPIDWPQIDQSNVPPAALPTGPEMAIAGLLPSSPPKQDKGIGAEAGLFDEVNFTRWCVNCSAATNYYPYWTIGKLYFTPAGGGSATCSASLVTSRNGRGSVLTAGHCVYTPGLGWSSNVVFRPSYRNGSSYGPYAVPTLWTLTTWAYYGDYGDDVGMGCPTSNLASTFGTLGLRWNASAVQDTHAFGYPSNISSGQYLIVCRDNTSASGSSLIKMGCDMTYGSSGGPWVDDFAPYFATNRNYVHSVVSHGNPPTPVFYGPYFDSNNIGLLYNNACVTQ